MEEVVWRMIMGCVQNTWGGNIPQNTPDGAGRVEPVKCKSTERRTVPLSNPYERIRGSCWLRSDGWVNPGSGTRMTIKFVLSTQILLTSSPAFSEKHDPFLDIQRGQTT